MNIPKEKPIALFPRTGYMYGYGGLQADLGVGDNETMTSSTDKALAADHSSDGLR